MFFKKKPSIRRDYSHGEQIEASISSHQSGFNNNPVFIESGCGISTISLNKCAEALNATCYSLDLNGEKSDELKSQFANNLNCIKFVIGDSHTTLPKLASEVEIDFLFLDSVPSALHTFKEFSICEESFHSGSCVLIDNAALPGETSLITPCRKGKIIVPYLLAHPFWEVFGLPHSGDSMVFAVKHSKPEHADDDFEMKDYIDEWEKQFVEHQSS